MDEKLEVIVQQEVGVINWNFEQLKAAVADKMKEYEVKVYTDETVPAAKADVATLRKLKKSVSDKRIEIKKKCLEPYEVIEAQAAELTALLDKPIEKIAGQIDEYEAKRREKVKAEILAYMRVRFGNFAEDISKKLQFKVYDPKWENATSTKKAWKDAIDKAADDTANDFAVLGELEEEFRDAALKEYGLNLSLSDTMIKVGEMRKQKEIILAKERERIAAEERAKAEAEAREKIEAEMKQEHKTPENEPETVKSEPIASEARVVQPTPRKSEYEPSTKSEEEVAGIVTLRIRATQSQLARIKGFIEYTGAVYREV